MEPLSGVGPLRPGWARVWVSLRREAPLSGCYLGCCVVAAARVLLRWSVCARVALAEKAQAACRRRWPLARTWGLGGIAGLPVWIQAAAFRFVRGNFISCKPCILHKITECCCQWRPELVEEPAVEEVVGNTVAARAAGAMVRIFACPAHLARSQGEEGSSTWSYHMC